jgi:hypothetical protein
VIFGAFYQSGQTCIGVKRILIHAEDYDRFKAMLVAKAKTRVAGDPKDRDTFIGPMISNGEAKRLKGWIDEAVAAGATLLCGGGLSRGNMLEATLLEGVPDDAKAKNEEAFGPLAILQRFHHFDEALEEVNNSKFGLQAGIFTRDLFQMFDAWDRLDVGGIVLGQDRLLVAPPARDPGVLGGGSLPALGRARNRLGPRPLGGRIAGRRGRAGGCWAWGGHRRAPGPQAQVPGRRVGRQRARQQGGRLPAVAASPAPLPRARSSSTRRWQRYRRR